MAAYLCEAGKINECQVEHMWRVDLEVNGLSVDAFVVARHSCRLVFDLALYIRKVIEAAVRNMVKLGPFRPSGNVGRFVGVGGRVEGTLVLGYVDELQDQGSSSTNATAAGQKVTTDNVFEDGGFPG